MDIKFGSFVDMFVGVGLGILFAVILMNMLFPTHTTQVRYVRTPACLLQDLPSYGGV